MLKKIFTEEVQNEAVRNQFIAYLEIIKTNAGDEKLGAIIKKIVFDCWKKDNSPERDNFLRLYNKISESMIDPNKVLN
jgi:hypothetical protein